ncbi:MAG: small basic protein [Candidatus Omnitrophica bacterium]|nr:small basic protein [Candidatus Omnitrophota bacterium]
MSIHRSLKSANTMKRHRSVLSRMERVRLLQEKGVLQPAESRILGLPKVKHLKMRIRKEKAAAAPGAAETAAGGTAPAAAPAAEASAAKPKK